MKLDFIKKEKNNIVYYTFESMNTKIRIVFYQENKNLHVNSSEQIPIVIYGKIENNSVGGYPKFGIKYETIVVNNEDLYETISYIVKDFLENYNDKIQYNFIKVDKTDSISDKKDRHHESFMAIIPNITIEQQNENEDLSKIKYIIRKN